MLMINLGGYKFETGVNPFDAVDQNYDYKWYESEPLRSEHRHQFRGKDKNKMIISGVIDTQVSGMRVLDALVNMADKGKAYLLVDGNGYNHGKWIITSIRKTNTGIILEGLPRKIKFTISLKRY